jgi:hypothetical protein
MASVISLNVGRSRDVDWRGRKVTTAIWKDPVAGPVIERRHRRHAPVLRRAASRERSGFRSCPMVSPFRPRRRPSSVRGRSPRASHLSAERRVRVLQPRRGVRPVGRPLRRRGQAGPFAAPDAGPASRRRVLLLQPNGLRGDLEVGSRPAWRACRPDPLRSFRGAGGVMPHPPAGAAGEGPTVRFIRSGLSVPWSDRFASLLELSEACDVPVQ